MTSAQLALLLLAAFWAGTSALIAGIKQLSDTRDKVVVGVTDGVKMSVEHRRRLLYYDWVPLRLALAAISLILALIIGSLPQLAGEDSIKPGLPLVCYITALVPFGGFLNFIVFGIAEWLFMKRELLKQPPNLPAAPH